MSLARTIALLDCHLRLDQIESRLDAGAKCGARSKPCGERCIPRRTKKGKPTKCNKATSQAAIEAHKQVQATEIGRLRQEQKGKRTERKTRKVKENLGTAQNAAVPTKGMVKGTKVANELESFLKGQLTDLQRTGALAKEAGDQAKLKNLFKVIEKQLEKTEELRKGLKDKRVERFNRLYKGKADPMRAKLASMDTKVFKALNPNRLIRVPKGTTQIEYGEIASKLASGDKAAIKQYTVPKPKKAKKSTKRKPKK